MASVRLENLSRRYGDAIALDAISFTVPDGAFWVLVGPSGCGKSTLLRTIAGLEPVMAGNLYIGDELVNQVRARQRDVAMVFQNYALYPHMTVAQNLGFGLRMRQVPWEQRQQRVATVAQALNLSHLLERKPQALSGGQQQRVALGRAIARQPRLFLLDEPLSNLDAQLRDETRAELKQLHQTFGITTLYVTHDQVEAMTLGDQVVVLDRGRIQQIGAPQAVYNLPANAMVASFLGSPPMNLWAAELRGDRIWLGDQSLPCPPQVRSHLAADSTLPVQLGVRPEHLQLATPEAAQLRGRVSLVEPLGRETLIRGTLSGDFDHGARPTLALQTLPGPTLTPGAELFLQLDMSRLFLFEPATGQRLFP